MFHIRKARFISIVLLLLFCSCNINTSKSSENQQERPEPQGERENADFLKAPQFEVTTLEGQEISLKQSLEDNKPLMIYFTATQCPICSENWRALTEVYPEFRERVNFVAVSIDPTDDEEAMTKIAQKNNLNFPLAKGRPHLMLDFGVSKSTTIGINLDGFVEIRQNKSVLTAEEYRALFNQLLD